MSPAAASPPHGGENDIRDVIGGSVSMKRQPRFEHLENKGPLDDSELQDAKPAMGIVPSTPLRKKRGRPRKHPVVDASKSAETSHARSKTGCGTCRNRKKKCDETKPECMNCEKTNVICDGYEPKKPWQSGKKKAADRLKRHSPGVLPDIHPLSIGVLVDTKLLRYFINRLVEKLPFSDQYNPFRDYIMSIGHIDRGIMHSILLLASSSSLANEQQSDRHILRSRQQYHRSMVFEYLVPSSRDLSSGATNDLPFNGKPVKAVAHALTLSLEAVAVGNQEHYEIHFHALKAILATTCEQFISDSEKLLRHGTIELLLYYEYTSLVTSFNHTIDHRTLAFIEELQGSRPSSFFLQVLDEPFKLMRKIRHLRDNFRQEVLTLDMFQTIDEVIEKWKRQPNEDGPYAHTRALYRQSDIVYYLRTLHPFQPSNRIREAVDVGLTMLEAVEPRFLLMPVFILGCSSFEEDQRRAITEALCRCKSLARLRNVERTKSIIREVWELMDQGNEEQSWDLETVVHKQECSYILL